MRITNLVIDPPSKKIIIITQEKPNFLNLKLMKNFLLFLLFEHTKKKIKLNFWLCFKFFSKKDDEFVAI